MSFHDIAGIYPLLRWLRVTGSARPMAVLERRNTLILDFLSNDAA